MPWDKQTAEEIAILENATSCLDSAIICFDVAIKWFEHLAESKQLPPGWEKSGILHMALRLRSNKDNLVRLRSTLPQGRLYEELKHSKAIMADIKFAMQRLEAICAETGNPTDARAHEKLVQALRRLEES